MEGRADIDRINTWLVNTQCHLYDVIVAPLTKLLVHALIFESIVQIKHQYSLLCDM